MVTQRLANIVFAIAVIIASIYFFIVAQGFKAAGLLAAAGLPSKFFPQLILGFVILCAALVAFLYLKRGAAGGDGGRTVWRDRLEAVRGLLTLAVAVVCYLIWTRYGFVAMAALMGPLCLIAMGERRIVIYLVVLALTALIYTVFTQVLGTRLN